MGKRGPAPTPTALLKKRGSWRAGDRGKEPEADGQAVKPDGLSEKAAVIWERIIPRLQAMKVLSSSDSTAVARYCEMLADYERCREHLDQPDVDDLIETIDKAGNAVYRDHPYVRRLERLETRLLRQEQQFGLTPAARASLGVQARKDTKAPMPKLVPTKIPKANKKQASGE